LNYWRGWGRVETLACDILVVGAGPAGSTAARVASQEGARVILVERKTQVGVPEQCAGYVAQAIRRHVTLPGECVAQEVNLLRTWLPDGTSHEVRMPGYLLNRALLDRQLSLQAVRAGARLLLRTAVTGLGEPARVSDCRMGEAVTEKAAWFGGLTATLMSEGREVLVDARVVIGADGPQSTVARRAGLTPGPLARAMQYEVVLPRRLEEAEVFFRPAFKGGYAWLFPAGETARVGASFDADNRTGKDGLCQLVRELQDQGRLMDSAVSYVSGFVPVGGPGPVRRGNVLLVGDAAGHAHPITGAGILNAIIAGESAGRAAARACLTQDPAALHDYEEDVDLVLGSSLARAREKRAGLERVWNSTTGDLSRSIRESWIAFDEYYSR